MWVNKIYDIKFSNSEYGLVYKSVLCNFFKLLCKYNKRNYSFIFCVDLFVFNDILIVICKFFKILMEKDKLFYEKKNFVGI